MSDELISMKPSNKYANLVAVNKYTGEKNKYYENIFSKILFPEEIQSKTSILRSNMIIILHICY